MVKFLAGVVVGGLGLFAYQRAHTPEYHEVVEQEPVALAAQPERPTLAVEVDSPQFHCDGRKYCSQMTSCEEATYFLDNCPDVKMDGEGDGVPCEKQWCGRH